MKKRIVKRATDAYLVLIVLFFSFGAYCQEQNQLYARLRLNDIKTLEEQQQITDYIRSKPGVSVCRTDRRTDVLYVLYNETVNLELFEDWLEELGFEVICLVFGTTNDHQIKELPCLQEGVHIETLQK